ncbi:hypothetical protein AOQ84DRAFT_329931 [Glonium stellatum]|uniref:Uncharacterized protein n=1 Tax=Glonium stellatum TaxID=574774 RepID=A0A8E2FDD5_9PEZI|nr:hypothetical protein AOQ84DRAFT_329931 [Glonium stellatum]
MGGLAFSTPGPNGDPPLHVPRLTTDVYNELKAKYTTLLQQIYRIAAVPHEAPGKLDHGDIDFLVEGPQDGLADDDVVKHLNAKRHIKNGPTRSYAVPLPHQEDSYVQVDIHICPDGHLKWDFFMNSYSDLWQIIGVAHRSLGITANDKGLNLRVQELEGVNRKASMIFLTDDPVRTMQFLGLDDAKYNLGFQDEDELFAWVSRGRFFNRDILEERTEKANDRRRVNMRGMYRRFLQEWVPSHPATGIQSSAWTREEVLSEALATFGKRAEYDAIIYDFHTQENEITLWKRIAQILPLKDPSLSVALRALKRWVRFDDGHPVLRSSAQLGHEGRLVWSAEMRRDKSKIDKDNDNHSGGDEERILKWVEAHWEEAKALEKKRVGAEKSARAVKKNCLESNITAEESRSETKG